MSEPADDSRTKEQLLSEIAQLKQHLFDFDGDGNGYRGPAYFEERLQEEVARSVRYSYEFSVVLVQLDNLEVYSRKAGEARTGEILDMFRTIIRDSIRKVDICCIFAPGKYGIILPYTGASGADIVCQRLGQTVERVFTLTSMAAKIPLTLSLGMATYPDDGISSDHVLNAVKDALATAQSKGGNCLVSAGSVDKAYANAMEMESMQVQNELLLHAMDDEVKRCSRYGQGFALLLMQFDTVKRREDLKSVREAVSTLIENTVRTLDRSFISGENRFALLLPSTSAEGAEVVAKKLLQACVSGSLPLANGKNIGISLNMGIACFPFDEISRDGLLKRAEASLSESLKKGTNCFTRATSLVKSTDKKLWGVQDWVAYLKKTGGDAVYNMVASLDLTEQYARPHSQSAARYAVVIGQGMGLPPALLRQIRIIGLFHDIGMMCLPAEIVTKPSRLTEREWNAMRKHSECGAQILSQFPEFSFCAEPVRSHHERWDGKGYPGELKGNNIPVEARIVAVAEALDDMVTPRPYKQCMPMKEAVEELKRNAGTQFDPAMVQALIKAAYLTQVRSVGH